MAQIISVLGCFPRAVIERLQFVRSHSIEHPLFFHARKSSNLTYSDNLLVWFLKNEADFSVITQNLPRHKSNIKTFSGNSECSEFVAHCGLKKNATKSTHWWLGIATRLRVHVKKCSFRKSRYSTLLSGKSECLSTKISTSWKMHLCFLCQAQKSMKSMSASMWRRYLDIVSSLRVSVICSSTQNSFSSCTAWILHKDAERVIIHTYSFSTIRVLARNY